MPIRQFTFSYSIYPNSYEREAVGGHYLLSFYNHGKTGYVLNYEPFALYTALKFPTSLFAERTMHISVVDADILLGERPVIDETYMHKIDWYDKQTVREVDFQTIQQGDKPTKEIERHELISSERTGIEADFHYLINFERSESLQNAWKHELESYDRINAVQDTWEHISELGEKLHSQQDILYVETIDARILNVAEITFKETIFADINTTREAFIDRMLIDTERYETRQLLVIPTVYLMERYQQDAHEIIPALLGEKNLHDGLIDSQVLWGAKLRYNAREDEDMSIGQKWTYSSYWHDNKKYVNGGEKSKHSANYQSQFQVKFAGKPGRSAYLAKRITWAILEANRMSILNSVTFASRYGKKSLTMATNYFATYHPRDSLIQKVMLQLEYEGVAGTIMDIFTQGYYEPSVDGHVFNEMEMGEYGPGDAFIDDLPIIGDYEGHEAKFSKTIEMERQEIQSELIWRTVLALENTSYREGIIEYLKDSEKIDFQAFIHYLNQAEVPDRHGLIYELVNAGRNESAHNRPAGLMDEKKQAWWVLGWDDLEGEWDDGWDYLSPPSKDYSYSPDKVYDDNGVPFDPIGPTNNAKVDVKMPVSHPTPQYADIGGEEAWVDLKTFHDFVLQIAMYQRLNKSKIAGLTGQQALQRILEYVDDFMKTATPNKAREQRMFRFIRWYAESITLKDSTTELNRTYQNWTDGIVEHGSFQGPHTIDYFDVDIWGLFTSSSTAGSITFDVENYIDGEFSFSQVITTSNPTSTTNLELYIDGNLIKTYTKDSGVTNEKFPVLQGSHHYELRYTAEIGDSVKVSGFTVSGVKFKSAFTVQRDNGKLRGLVAINHLLQALLTYYLKHHKQKIKGAFDVKQRKIWLQ